MTELHRRTIEAIQSVQQHATWKPGSAIRHLNKRKSREHLPEDATVEDYEQIIRSVVSDNHATVYIYQHDDIPFIVVVTEVQAQH